MRKGQVTMRSVRTGAELALDREGIAELAKAVEARRSHLREFAEPGNRRAWRAYLALRRVLRLLNQV